MDHILIMKFEFMRNFCVYVCVCALIVLPLTNSSN